MGEGDWGGEGRLVWRGGWEFPRLMRWERGGGIGWGQVDEDDEDEDEERETWWLRGQCYCGCPGQLTLHIGQTYHWQLTRIWPRWWHSKQVSEYCGWFWWSGLSTGTPCIVPVVRTSWFSSAFWMANSMAAVRGEEEAEGVVCGLVAAVNLAEYCSTSATNSGMWNWWKREKRSSWMVCWMAWRVLQRLPILVGEEARSRRVLNRWTWMYTRVALQSVELSSRWDSRIQWIWGEYSRECRASHSGSPRVPSRRRWA